MVSDFPTILFLSPGNILDCGWVGDTCGEGAKTSCHQSDGRGQPPRQPKWGRVPIFCYTRIPSNQGSVILEPSPQGWALQRSNDCARKGRRSHLVLDPKKIS